MGFFNKDETSEQLKSEQTENKLDLSALDLFNAQVKIMQAIIAHKDYKFNTEDLKEYEIPSNNTYQTSYKKGYRYDLVANEAYKYIKAML